MTADQPTTHYTTDREHEGFAITRAGLRRRTVDRRSSGECRDCWRSFTNITSAIAHCQRSGHVVEGHYSAVYTYERREATP